MGVLGRARPLSLLSTATQVILKQLDQDLMSIIVDVNDFPIIMQQGGVKGGLASCLQILGSQGTHLRMQPATRTILLHSWYVRRPSSPPTDPLKQFYESLSIEGYGSRL